MSNIEMGKKYRTRSGLSVRILAVDLDIPDYPVCAVHRKGKSDGVALYTANGKLVHGGANSTFDLIEVGPYDHIKIDDPVLAAVGWPAHIVHRHFAGVSQDGRPTVWAGGTTSWTSATMGDGDPFPCTSVVLFDPSNPEHAQAVKL